MTWYDHIEQKRNLLVGGMLAICAAALTLAARRKPVSFDSFWHLQTGLDWVHRGLSPWIDHFSFTFAGQPIKHQPFMFQAVLAWTVDGFGLELGFGLIKLVSFLLALGLFALFLRRLRAPVIVYLLTLPALTLLLELRAAVRPELISYGLSIIAMMLYRRADSRISLRSMLPITALMLFWTNYHTSVLGYVLFFGLFVDAAVLQIREKSGYGGWLRWLLWGLVVLAVGFFNRNLSHPLIEAFQFAPEWADFIQEYESPALYRGVVGIYAILALAIATVVISARRRRLGFLVVTLVLCYLSAQMVRLVTPCGIIVLQIFACLVSDLALESRPVLKNAWQRRLAAAGIAAAVIMSTASAFSVAKGFMRENRTSALIRPESITAHISDRGMSGRIFNEYGIGGYLIHMLSPEITVYIDGRTNILYPVAHYQRYLQARNSPIELREEIERYDINLALLETDQRAYSVMFESGLMGLDYVDYGFSFFTRDNPRLPFAGRLLGNPACWREEYNPQLEAEFGYALLNLPANSSALPNLGMMLGYFLAPDREQFLRGFGSSPSPTELQLRFAGYQSLLLGLYEESVNFFEAIEVWDHREFLAAALAYARLGLWEKAEETIDHLTMILWPHVTDRDMLLLYRILETIRREQGLQRVQGSYLDELRGQLEDSGRSTVELDLDLSLLCTDPTLSDPVAS